MHFEQFRKVFDKNCTWKCCSTFQDSNSSKMHMRCKNSKHIFYSITSCELRRTNLRQVISKYINSIGIITIIFVYSSAVIEIANKERNIGNFVKHSFSIRFPIYLYAKTQNASSSQKFDYEAPIITIPLLAPFYK